MAKVGEIVKLKVACLENPVGTLGVCYEEYNIGEPGAGSYIFANGNYDGFSPKEQAMFLETVGHEPSIEGYEFKNVIRLGDDFRAGIFDKALTKGTEGQDRENYTDTQDRKSYTVDKS